MQFIRRMTILQRMTALFTLCVLLPCAAFSLVLYRQTLYQHIAEAVNQNMMTLRSMSLDVRTRAAQVEIIVEELAHDEDVQRLFSPISRERQIVTLVSSLIETLQRGETYLSNLSADLLLIAGSETMPERYSTAIREQRLAQDESFQDFLASGMLAGWGTASLMYPGQRTASGDESEQQIPYYQNVYSGVKRRVGTIKCGVSKEKLFASLASWNEPYGALLAYARDKCVFRIGDADIPAAVPRDKDVFREGDTLYLSSHLPDVGVTLMLAIPYAVLRAQSQGLSLGALAVCLLCALLLLIVCRLILSSLLRRLDSAMYAIRHLPQGEYSIRLPGGGTDEVGQLVDTFNDLLAQTGLYVEELLQKERDKRQAQILAFQYQVNPHFLFNALYWLQMQLEAHEIPAHISESVALLGGVLHYNLSDSSTASLLEERHLMEAYVQFTSLVKETPIVLKACWPEALDRVRVPRFFFQPLLENAVRYGQIAGRTLTLSVRIQPIEAGKALRIEVFNDGRPIDSEQLAVLRARLLRVAQQGSDRNESGIGLTNLVKRLYLFYAGAARVEVESNEERTQFVIQIPLGKEEPYDVSDCR